MNYVINQIKDDLEGLEGIQYLYFGEPESLGSEVIGKGAIAINPLTTDIVPITTGTTDEYVFNIELVVYKLVRGTAKNAQEESGDEFMTRIVEGRAADGSLLTNSIVQILKRNQRSYGIQITDISVVYDSSRSDIEGAVTATINVGILKHEQQLIN
jgi:hypothetical protein